jgi:glycosyltransferase involved in cell wall biosynthesis
MSHAGIGMPAPQPFLVYRDRIGAPSEIGFLRRQYVGFTRLHPVWIGRTLLTGAEDIGSDVLRLGGNALLGPLHRLLFRHFGVVPRPLGTPARHASPHRHGPACPGHPLPHRAAIGRPDKPGHDDGIGWGGVLHAQFARGGALALPLARALNLRLVVTLHGGDVSKQKNWRGTVLAQRWPALVRETACFVCVSAAVAEIAAARGVPPDKLTVLPIGVEIPDHPPAAGQPTAHLFAGRFVEKKGILVIADAIRRLRTQGDATPLVCVGDGPLRPVLEALARDAPGVTLTGWLPPEAVRACMQQSVSLLVPSVIAAGGDAEGLPSVIPEAMAQGCPVIGSDQGGIAEAIRHSETGLLIRPGDAGALAEAMGRLVHERGLRTRLSANGFAYAAEALNARIQSEKLENLLLSARDAAG